MASMIRPPRRRRAGGSRPMARIRPLPWSIILKLCAVRRSSGGFRFLLLLGVVARHQLAADFRAQGHLDDAVMHVAAHPRLAAQDHAFDADDVAVDAAVEH